MVPNLVGSKSQQFTMAKDGQLVVVLAVVEQRGQGCEMVEERQFVGLIKDRMTELANSVCNPVVLWCLEFVNCKQFNDVQKGDMYVNYVWKGNVLYILIIFWTLTSIVYYTSKYFATCKNESRVIIFF